MRSDMRSRTEGAACLPLASNPATVREACVARHLALCHPTTRPPYCAQIACLVLLPLMADETAEAVQRPPDIQIGGCDDGGGCGVSEKRGAAISSHLAHLMSSVMQGEQPRQGSPFSAITTGNRPSPRP